MAESPLPFGAKGPLQLPKLKLEWKKTEADEKAFKIMARKINDYWNRHLAAICRLEWKPEFLSPNCRMVDSAYDLAHPAGSTRMGSNPSKSVVDAHLRVHRMQFERGERFRFPSSGSANPTLTIMELALRATDAIAKRLPA